MAQSPSSRFVSTKVCVCVCVCMWSVCILFMPKDVLNMAKPAVNPNRCSSCDVVFAASIFGFFSGPRPSFFCVYCKRRLRSF